MESLSLSQTYRTPSKGCEVRNKTLSRFVKQHEEAILSDEQYFDRVVAAIRQYDLPGILQIG